MKYDSTYSALRELNKSVGGVDIRFDSEYSIWRNINSVLGGDDKRFDSVLSIVENIKSDIGSIKLGTLNLDFTTIGYSAGDSKKINSMLYKKYEDDIDYASILYDAWNPNNTTASSLFQNDIKLSICPFIDTSKVTSMWSMFGGCDSLISIPQLDTSKVTSMDYMFDECNSLISIPQLDTSKVTSMSGMFGGCNSLISIPQLDTSNVTGVNGMFKGCSSLTSIPQLDTSKAKYMGEMFSRCSSLTSIPLLDCGSVTNTYAPFDYNTLGKLTDLGGFKDLKVGWTSNFLDRVPNATVESLMNVINNLYDLTANGLSGQTLKFGTTNLQKLTADQIAVATNKGWTLN